MALDPHPDREPGMDARVVVVRYLPRSARPVVMSEWAKSCDTGLWESLGYDDGDFLWPDLAAAFPDATVVLPTPLCGAAHPDLPGVTCDSHPHAHQPQFNHGGYATTGAEGDRRVYWPQVLP